MNQLTISGFKKNAQQNIPPQNLNNDDSGNNPPVPPINNEPPVNQEPPTTEPPVNNEPPVNQEPPTTEPPVQQQNNTGQQPVLDSSLKPNVSEPAQPSAPQFTDESALTFLSEKLGRQVSSFDEFKPVENPLDKDPYLKSLHEWREKTGRPIQDFVKYQKDYNQLSDLDVAREFLQHEYPTLTPAEIQLELKKFQATEDDLDSDVSMKNLELKKYATKGRNTLESLKVQFSEPLPNTGQASFTPEVQQDLDLAKQVKLQQVQFQQAQQEYEQGLNAAAMKTEALPIQLSDDLTVNFKVSDETRKVLPNYISEMPHWKNSDGSWNHQAVASDAVKIKHFNEIIKLVYEQGLNAGKEDLSKQANNVTLGTTTTMQSQPNDGKKKGKIEDFDKFLGTQTLKIGKRR